MNDILGQIIITSNDLIQIFKRGPGYKQFPLNSALKYSKHLSTMFISVGGQGLLHHDVVESCIERLHVLIKELHNGRYKRNSM
jgi:hypothetical protein